jgi:hypothetical protein
MEYSDMRMLTISKHQRKTMMRTSQNSPSYNALLIMSLLLILLMGEY